MRIIYIGGPTAVLDIGGVRLLTDPTFDPAGAAFELPAYTLTKTRGPALQQDEVGRIDAVLLSHDHHFDNLDRGGREFLSRVPHVLTTAAGAGRLGGTSIGMAAWDTQTITAPDGGSLLVTATPARHGPAGGDRGPVIGFALQRPGDGRRAVYVSGDTVWFDGVREVAGRFDVSVAVLFAGAAKVAVAGPSAITFTAEDAVTAARAMPHAAIVPLHFEGWEHFTESRVEIDRAFRDADLRHRLRWPEPGTAVSIQD